MRVTIFALALVLSLAMAGGGVAACGNPTGPIIFGFPPNVDHGTEILTVDDGKMVAGFAIDLSETSVRLPLNINADEPAHLEAMIYEKTPEELNQKEGPLEMLPEGTRIRNPALSYQLAIRNGVAEAWSLLDEPSEASMRFLPSNACAKFQTAPIFVGAEESYVSSAAIDGESALLIARSFAETPGHYYVADAHDVHPIADLTPGYIPRRVIAVPGGKMFLAAWGGAENERAMFSGDPVHGFRAIEPRPIDSNCYVSGMDYARTGETDPPIYVIDQCGHIDRYQSGRWTSLRAAPMEFDYDQQLAWVSVNELVFVTANGAHLHRLKNGVEEEISTDLPIDQVISLATIDGFGTYAGMISGWVLKYTGTTWTTFREPFIATIGAWSFGGFAGNLLIAGNDGDIQHWVDPDFCEEPTYVGINLGISDVVPLEFGIVATGLQFLTTTGERRFFAAVLKRE